MLKMIQISNSPEEIVRAREDQMVNETFAMMGSKSVGMDIGKYQELSANINSIMKKGYSFSQALDLLGYTEEEYNESERLYNEGKEYEAGLIKHIDELKGN
jgi:hypothetical protein